MAAHLSPAFRRENYQNLYLIDLVDSKVLYAPLVGLSVEVDDRAADFIEHTFSGYDDLNFPAASDWTEFLDDLERMSLQAIAPHPKAPEQQPSAFAPTGVTLSLTANCNLKCVYCYIRGGERDQNMNPEIALASIDFVSTNALKRNLDKFEVAFHGEGEPTFNWALFTEAVNYAERVAKEKRLNLSLNLTSNGMWSKAQLEFIAEKISDISMSIDGLQTEQDVLRPTSSGKSSFGVVSRNLLELRARGVECGIRATVTPININGIIPFLNFLVEEAGLKSVRLEPIFSSGRANDLPSDEQANRSFDAEFAKRFLEAREYGESLGMRVDYSGCGDVSPGGRFCGATGHDPNFVVMTSGLVSSCYEVNKKSHRLGEFFVYGYFMPSTGTFRFLEDKLQRLMSFNTKSGSSCSSCFAQWNCVGDCLARYELKSLLEGGTSNRCGLNKTLNRAAIAASVGRSISTP